MGGNTFLPPARGASVTLRSHCGTSRQAACESSHWIPLIAPPVREVLDPQSPEDWAPQEGEPTAQGAPVPGEAAGEQDLDRQLTGLTGALDHSKDKGIRDPKIFSSNPNSKHLINQLLCAMCWGRDLSRCVGRIKEKSGSPG